MTEPPGPPRGPLEVSGMTKTSFTIKWEPPENDGGTPVTDYIIEIKEVSKKAWQKVSVVLFVYIDVETIICSIFDLYISFRLQVLREKSLMLLYLI